MLYLNSSMPDAAPCYVLFEGVLWGLWPVETAAVAAQLERWVVQEVRRNVELLRPDADDPDPVKWDVYRKDREEAQAAIRKGKYEALSADFNEMVHFTRRGFEEALYQCVAFCHTEAQWAGDGRPPEGWKPPTWTRDHVKRLLASPEDKAEVESVWFELNFPKVKAPPETGPESSETSIPGGPSAGEASSPAPSCTTAST